MHGMGDFGSGHFAKAEQIGYVLIIERKERPC